ncbi:CST complex subunit STN1 isoform X3 [Syngnathus acus]|uniref:CST complex subunit STN1 isoform X3 n=1 Tax=Syngnathus acus TaxID=161584 RepID=UPI0018860E3B|nr:CST complex subunit STN1 isoform X3 [Syngnathus acus]
MDEDEVELPSMLWGLDPIFSAFARLHITDILDMKESCQVSDMGKPQDNLQGGFNLAVERKKLRHAQQTHGSVEIGELLRVRGRVKTSRQQREIIAYMYYKVNDPVMAVQIEWMLEVLQLYREFYDKPLHLKTNTASESPFSSLSKATHIIKDLLEQRSVSKFRPYDIQDLLQPLFLSCNETAHADQEPVAGPSTYRQLRILLKEALNILQDEGIVYQRMKSPDEVYFVTAQDKDLLMIVKDIIREDSKKEKYRETGCHILHILSSVRQRYSLNVSKPVLELVLKSLECKSDIVSTRDNYFTMF